MKALPRLALLAGLLLGAGSAGATTFAPLTIEQKVDAADAIVRGTVVEVVTVRDAHGYTWTHADVEVETVLKGAPPAKLTVEAAGGLYDGVMSDVGGAARYAVGEEVVLFLSEHPSRNTWGTVQMFGGKWTVRQNPASGDEMVVQLTASYATNWDPRFLPHPAPADRVSLDSFEDRIRARVTAGWDGKPIPGITDEKLRSINHIQNGAR